MMRSEYSEDYFIELLNEEGLDQGQLTCPSQKLFAVYL